MVIGKNNTHDIYSPDSLIKQAMKCDKINLFGLGDDIKDFIYIDDLVFLTHKIIKHSYTGTYNLASGFSVTYLNLAQEIVKNIKNNIVIDYIHEKTVQQCGFLECTVYPIEANKKPTFNFIPATVYPIETKQNPTFDLIPATVHPIEANQEPATILNETNDFIPVSATISNQKIGNIGGKRFKKTIKNKKRNKQKQKGTVKKRAFYKKKRTIKKIKGRAIKPLKRRNKTVKIPLKSR
jgi:hypothetical protein